MIMEINIITRFWLDQILLVPNWEEGGNKTVGVGGGRMRKIDT